MKPNNTWAVYECKLCVFRWLMILCVSVPWYFFISTERLCSGEAAAVCNFEDWTVANWKFYPWQNSKQSIKGYLSLRNNQRAMCSFSLSVALYTRLNPFTRKSTQHVWWIWFRDGNGLNLLWWLVLIFRSVYSNVWCNINIQVLLYIYHFINSFLFLNSLTNFNDITVQFGCFTLWFIYFLY